MMIEDLSRDYDEYRKWNRDLSDNDCRSRYAENRGVDEYDVDAAIREDNERRRAYYRAMDGY